MADLAEVGDALVNIIAQAAYPHGVERPSIAACDIAVYQGWPNPKSLEAALKAGQVQISVFPRPGDQVTTVMAGDGDWQELSNDGTRGVSIREIRRQTRTFQIIVWANSHRKRDPVAKIMDSVLAATSRLTLPDGAEGVMTYMNSIQDDNLQKQNIYRRDLFYAVNYPITQTAQHYMIKQTRTNVSTGPTPDVQGPVTIKH